MYMGEGTHSIVSMEPLQSIEMGVKPKKMQCLVWTVKCSESEIVAISVILE